MSAAAEYLSRYTPPATGAARGRLPVATIVQVVPDVTYPWDPAVVRAIRREFDPNMVPVWIRKVYKHDTGGVEVTGYHGIASHKWSPDVRVPLWVYRALMPTVGGFERPTSIHLHLREKDPQGVPIPGSFVPFDWRIYDGLISGRDEMTTAERKQFLKDHGREAEAAKASEAAHEQAAQRWKDDGAWIKRRAQEITASDIKEAVHKKPEPPKPFVFLGDKRRIA